MCSKQKGKEMQHLLDMSEKDFRNMNTVRLNAIRKRFTKLIATWKSRDLDESDQIMLRKYQKHFELLKDVLSEREHLENPRVKTPRRENKRDRKFD